MDVQNVGIKKVVDYLKHLGLSSEESRIYLYLLENSQQTVLAISRGLKTGRTKLYPMLEQLAAKQLINIHERHYGTTYETQAPEVIEFLVTEQEQKSENLRRNLPSVLHMLSNLRHGTAPASKVVEYHGKDGLKQMNWNLSKADQEYRVFELAGLDKHLGLHFADKMRGIFAERQLHGYNLTNNSSRRHEPGADSAQDHVRYIDSRVFKIEFETYIYNSCVALLSYDKEDIFGVEIYNDRLARQQKQLFDLLWSQAKQL